MALFGKQGYIKIAAILKAAHREFEDVVGSPDAIEDLTIRLADLFERDSQAFDRQRFYREVGIETIPMREEQRYETAN